MKDIAVHLARSGALNEAQFGKYTVLGVLGHGGMAEALKCRLSGMGGFDKTVVVKRILPHLNVEPDFVSMFLTEARVSANLSHPNVVQIFEIDECDGIPYISMEYVNGPTLLRLMRTAQRAKNSDIGNFAFLAAEVAAGLQYVHSAVDDNHQPLHLVHRDVSPTNVVVSLEGVPKLLDFGVAKSGAAMSKTDSGLIKGKLRYMSPEQIQNSSVDGRSDVFSLGVCLYEATVFRSPFFVGPMNEVALLKAIVEGRYAKPSEVLPSYPPQLEKIVLSAIETDVKRRCPSADALREQLSEFCSTGEFATNRKRVSQWVQKLVVFEAENPASIMPRTSSAQWRSSATHMPKATGVSRVPFRTDEIEIEIDDPSVVTTTRVRLRLLTALAVVGIVGLLVMGGLFFFRPEKPASTTVSLTPVPIAKSQPPDTLPVSAPSVVPAAQSETGSVAETPALPHEADSIAPQPAPNGAPSSPHRAPTVATRFAKLSVTSTPSSKVFVDGEPMGQTPLDLDVPAGLHRLKLRLEGYVSAEKEVRVYAGRRSTVSIPLVQEKAALPEKAKATSVQVTPLAEPPARPKVIILDENRTQVPEIE
jgi:eukaryotic-like serine/threonine-protein kinase